MDYFATLDRWYQLTEAIARLQAEERALREGLFNGTFPSPREGVNKVELPDGRVLKGTYRINRKVLEDKLQEAKFPKSLRDNVFKTKHDLIVSAYRNLDEDTRNAVDAVLEIKPAGLHGLELVLPKLPKE